MTTLLSRTLGLQALFFLMISGIAINVPGSIQLSEALWGAALSSSQTALLVVLGYRVFYKKGVALTLLVSVFKYGILLGIFLLAWTGQLKITGSFVLGFLTVVPSLTGFIFLKPKMNGQDNGSL